MTGIAKKELLEALGKCMLFQGMNTDELNSLIECMKPKIHKYKRNEIIVDAGENFTGIGILLQGEAIVAKESVAGSRMIISVLKPGDMFGEMAAFSGKGKWPATVTAQTSSSALFLPPEKILGQCPNLCFSHKTLIMNMLSVISKKALMLNKKLEYLTIKSLKGKIASFLLEHHKLSGNTMFMLPMSRNELADFFNVSRPSLSREMCKMRDEGIIEFHRSSVMIKDIEALKEMVEV